MALEERLFQVLMVILLIGAGLTFDFASFFGRHGNESSSSSDGEGNFSSYQEKSADLNGRCSGYLCDFGNGPCVENPMDCPCRPEQYKCVHGPNNAFACMNSKDSCSRLLREI